VILDVLGWLVVADAVAAAMLALAIYVAGRRSSHRVTVGKVAGLAGCLTLPAVLLYGIVWLWIRRI
jgi:Kef-type K+ transport system membrane component KefB